MRACSRTRTENLRVYPPTRALDHARLHPARMCIAVGRTAVGRIACGRRVAVGRIAAGRIAVGRIA
eukprot:959522-Pleurochrysis_carterae.AAC.1